MQSYRGEEGPGSASSNPYAGGSGRSGSEMAVYPTAGTEHGDVSRKYQSQYEETINPFEAFRGRVSIFALSECVCSLTLNAGTNPRIPISQPARTDGAPADTAYNGKSTCTYAVLPLRYRPTYPGNVHVVFVYIELEGRRAGTAESLPLIRRARTYL